MQNTFVLNFYPLSVALVELRVTCLLQGPYRFESGRYLLRCRVVNPQYVSLPVFGGFKRRHRQRGRAQRQAELAAIDCLLSTASLRATRQEKGLELFVHMAIVPKLSNGMGNYSIMKGVGAGTLRFRRIRNPAGFAAGTREQISSGQATDTTQQSDRQGAGLLRFQLVFCQAGRGDRQAKFIIQNRHPALHGMHGTRYFDGIALRPFNDLVLAPGNTELAVGMADRGLQAGREQNAQAMVVCHILDRGFTFKPRLIVVQLYVCCNVKVDHLRGMTFTRRLQT